MSSILNEFEKINKKYAVSGKIAQEFEKINAQYSLEEDQPDDAPHGARGGWEEPGGPLTLGIPFTDLKYDFGKTPIIGQPLEKAATILAGILGKTTAGIEKGLTLGALDPERGTVGVPVIQNIWPETRVQLTRPLGEHLAESGVPERLAESPWVGLPGEILGSAAPVGAISRGVSAATKGVQSLAAGTKLATVGETAAKGTSLLRRAGQLAGRVGHAATVGGIVSTTHDIEPGKTMWDNIKTGAIYGAGTQIVAEGIGAIANAVKLADKTKAYRSLRDSLAEWAYGEGRYKSLNEAKKDIGQMINNDIQKMGGLKNVTKEQAKQMQKFVQSQGKTPPVDVTPKAKSGPLIAEGKPSVTPKGAVSPAPVVPPVKPRIEMSAYTGPERRVDLETRQEVDEGKVTPEQLAELRRQKAFLEERKAKREAEEAAKQQAIQTPDKPVTLKQRQEQTQSKQTSSITINRVGQEPFTVKRGDRVRVYLGKDETGQSRFEEKTVIGVSPTKKTVKAASDNAAKTGGVEYDQGNIYPLEKKIEPAQPKVNKIISVDKAPPGGWAEKDKVPAPKKEAPAPVGALGKEGATFKAISEFGKRVKTGQVTAQEVRDQFQFMLDHEAEIKQSVLDYINSSDKHKRKRKDTKAKLVEDTFDRELQRLGYAGDSILSYSRPLDSGDYRQSMIGAIKKNLDKLTDEAIQTMAAKNKEYEENFRKTYTDPETLSQFRDFIRLRGEKALSPEQKARYDELIAEETKAQKAKELEGKGTVTQVKTDAGMKYTETKHTKTGVPLHVVSLDSRVDREVFNELNRKAKMLGGYYSSFRGAGAVPGFQFKTKEAADQFMALKEGDVSRATTLKERQAEAKQTAAERLREMAEKIEEKANESLNRDRLANTVRRARMAASAEESARSELAFAETMKNLAEAIASGQAKYLDGIKAQTHIQLLNSLLNKARLKANEGKITNDMSYSERESIRGRAPELSDIEFAEYPYPEVHADRIQSLIKNYLKDKSPGYAARLSKMIRETPERHGYKLVKFKSDRQIDLLRRTIDKLKSLKADEYDLRAITEELADYDRIKTMGIDSLPHLRAALREYLQYKGKRQQADPIKEMERELIGTKIPGYFPTPKQYSQEVVERADIKPGMDVLEPSAGKGNIADEVPKDVNLSVIEVNPSLREILTKKGYNLVGQDFLEHTGKYDRILMNPPFENGQDIDHVKHAYELLKPSGRVVAIMSEGTFFRNDKKATEFREWLESVGGISEKLPEGAFKSSERPTGVNTRMVVIDMAGEAVSGQNKPDLTKLEAVAKEAGFKDLDEAVLAFQAKKNGVEWFKEQEGSGSGEKYTELVSKVDEIAPGTRKEFEMDLQMFAKKDNSLPIDDRNYEMVSKRDVRAYQQLHPELADFIQAEAIRIIGELSDTVKGERFVTHVRGEETVATGVPKMTSETIQRIQDVTGASYADIGGALEAIAKGTAGINTALAKKIELIIDDNLTNGVTDIRGNQIEPDASYKFAKDNVKPITDLELYDAKQIEKLKAKYEARIARLKERDRAKLKRQLAIIKYYSKERLQKVKETHKKTLADVREAHAKKVKRIKQQELWRRLLLEKEMKGDKKAAVKALREAQKQREQRQKEERKQRLEEKRRAAKERELRNSMINNLKKIRSKLYKMRPEFQRPVKEILDGFNLATPTLKTITRLNRIAQYLEAHPENKIPKEKIARLKVLSRKNIRDLSIEDLRTLHDSILHYVHLNILKNKLILQGRYREAAEIRNDAIERIRKLSPSDTPGAVETSRPKTSPNPLVRLHKLQLNEEVVTQMLDGEKKGTFYKVFYEGADEGRDLELSVKFAAQDQLKEGLKKAGIKPEDLMPWSEYFNVRKKDVEYNTVRLESGQDFTFTKGDRMALYLHSLNDNNRASVLKGGIYPEKNRTLKIRLTEKDLNNILAGMTEEEKAVADIFHDIFNGLLKDKLNERSLELDGFHRGIVENYYPKKTPALEKKIDALKARDNPYARFLVEGMGFLKERTGAKKPIILEDAFKTFFLHLEGLSAYYGRATYLRNAKMLLYNKQFRTELERIDNGFTWKRLEQYVNDYESFGAKQDDIGRVTARVMNKIDTSILAANAKVIVKQFLSYPLMFNQINPKYLLSTVGKKVDWDIVFKYSPQLRQRREGDISVETGELGRVGAVRRFFTGKEAIGFKLTQGIERADALQLANAWNAVEAEIQELHPDLKPGSDKYYRHVAKRTEEVFRKSQSVYDPKDRSELGRSENLAWRIFTRFTSQRNVIYNEMVRAKLDWDQSRKTAKDFATVTLKLFNCTLIASSLMLMIDMMWDWAIKRKKPKELKQYLTPWQMASRFLGDVLSYSYMTGEVWNGIMAVHDRGAYGYDLSTPLTDTAKDMIISIGQMAATIEQIITKERYRQGPHRGKKKWKVSIKKALDNAMSALTRFRGLPYHNIKTLVKAGISYFPGKKRAR